MNVPAKSPTAVAGFATPKIGTFCTMPFSANLTLPTKRPFFKAYIFAVGEVVGEYVPSVFFINVPDPVWQAAVTTSHP